MLQEPAMIRRAFLNQAEELVRNTENRVTATRVKILAFLLAQECAVTHQQIETALGEQEKIDRVTLYRVLDWLAGQGLVHRIVSGDRVWRFRANNGGVSLHHQQHAHFKCQQCGKVICLDDVRLDYEIPLSLPDGYRGQEIELTVKGLCAQCA